ncbi:MAG: peptide deformylase [Bdellovibrionota bacterium]
MSQNTVQQNNENLKQEFVQYSSGIGKKILYEPTKPVDAESIGAPKIQKIISSMKAHLQGKGIGLAANQIGEPLQIFMIEYRQDTERYKYLNFPSIPLQVFINPRITAASKEKMSFWHGCLSALDKPRGLIATYQWIEYEAYDENGHKKTGKLDGLGAVIFQHEFRHLLGSLYIDHAKIFLNQEELKQLFESHKLNPYEPANDDIPLLLADYEIGAPIFK